MSGLDFEQLIRHYGYLALLVGTFLEGETVLILGGIAAQQGHLRLPLVLLVAFLGSFSGDQTAYFVGRRFGPRLLARPKWQERVERVRRILVRHRIPILIGFRFVYGIRVAGPVAFGLSKIPASTFSPLNAVGAVAWACLIGGLGYAFGAAVTPYLERAKHYQAYVIGGIVGTALILGLALYLRRRVRQRRAVPEPAPAPAPAQLSEPYPEREPAR